MPIGINALPNIKIIGKYFTISSNYLLTAFTYKKYCNCLHTQITLLLPMPFIGTSHNSVGVSLPWWCHPLFLLAPGYWRLYLNLVLLFQNWKLLNLRSWNEVPLFLFSVQPFLAVLYNSSCWISYVLRGWCAKFATRLNIKIGIAQKIYELWNCSFA